MVSQFWSQERVDDIESEHRALRMAYQSDSALRSIIATHDHTTMFNQAWDDLQQGAYDTLRSFCGGLANAFANTTSVESDSSVLKNENNPFRQSMTHLSLEGIFQCKRHAELLVMKACLSL